MTPTWTTRLPDISDLTRYLIEYRSQIQETDSTGSSLVWAQNRPGPTRGHPYLESFKNLMHLQGVVDEIMCQAFPTMLKGPVRVWFSRLMPNSIATFKELSAQFASYFIGTHRYKEVTYEWQNP